MFCRVGKTWVAGLVTATLLGGVSAAAAAERLPRPAAPKAAAQGIRSAGFQGWLSSFLEPIRLIFYEGPRIDPLGTILDVLPLDGAAPGLDAPAPR